MRQVGHLFPYFFKIALFGAKQQLLRVFYQLTAQKPIIYTYLPVCHAEPKRCPCGLLRF